MIILLTGIPCSGKTTIAQALADDLIQHSHSVELLDGDDLRNNDFSCGVGFSPTDRERHLLRVAYMARRLDKFVEFVICSFVAPIEAVRQLMKPDLVVWCQCTPAVAAERDTKGMWAKAKAGQIKGFTGYDAPYEPPIHPGVTLLTAQNDVEYCVRQVLVEIFMQKTHLNS